MSLITITSSLGCDGLEIARNVAEKMKVALFDDQRLQEEAVKMGLSPDELKSLDEKKPGLLDRMFTRKPEAYRNMMESLIYQVAQGGEGIITGHGAALLLRDFSCAFHVRLGGSFEGRVQNLVQTQEMKQDTAEKVVRRNDRDKASFMEFHFQKDWNDLSLYDLAINRDKLGSGTAVDLIVQAAQANEVSSCSLTAVESMENLALAHKVEAVIIKQNFSIASLNVEVVKKGEVEVTGWLRDHTEKDKLTAAINSTPGVTKASVRVVAVPYAG